MKDSFVSTILILAAFHAVAAAELETNVFESAAAPVAESQLDRLVFSRLERLKIQPVLCSDAVFVRRAYLDVLGTLPTAEEARRFILDADTPDKRGRLIDRLMEREEFADYWAMKWGDILRIKAEFPVNLWPNAAQAYHRWVRASLAKNKPYDQFAREMLTASGSNFRVGAVNFYRAIQNRTPEGIAGAVSLTFMGVRPESWPTDRFKGMTAFFSRVAYKPTSEWKEEHVFWDPLGSSTTPGNTAPGRAAIADIAQPTNAAARVSAPALTNRAPPRATFPDGTKADLSPERDPREVFADWLIQPGNPWFTRSIVNRVWAWLLGRGIIHEPDDIREDNPPSNPALLAHLEKHLIASNYDLRSLYRLILKSQTYQLSSLPRSEAPEAAASFASYSVRRLDAEVLSDAINKITGSSDLYTSPIPEPFTYIPKGMPAVAIADGSITSPFLALFGRSARATGLENERNNKPTPAQWLYLLNSSDIQIKLESGPNLQAIIGFGRKSPREIAEELYLSILTRFPTPEELNAVENYAQSQMVKPPPPRTDSTNASAAASAETKSTNTSLTAGTNAPLASQIVVRSNQAAKGRPLGSLGLPGKKASLAKRRDDWLDIAWALMNSEEFLYRH